MFTFIHKQFFALFFLFVKIKIAIVFKRIFRILIIKICNFVISITLNNLRFNKDNFNIKSRNRNNEEKTFLKKIRF